MKKIAIALLSITALAACGNESTEVKETPKESIEQETNTPAEISAETPAISDKEKQSADSNKEDIEQNQPQKDSSQPKTTKQNEYKNKLDSIQTSITAIENTDINATQAELLTNQTTIYEKWDTALNHVYNEIKKDISSEEMAILKEEQLEWIKNRDAVAKEESLVFVGGTMEPLYYVMAQSRLTKERSYELVSKYMK